MDISARYNADKKKMDAEPIDFLPLAGYSFCALACVRQNQKGLLRWINNKKFLFNVEATMAMNLWKPTTNNYEKIPIKMFVGTPK